MRSQKGITLVALVITIIVMLILVGVSVTMALNGGLFNTAKDAASQTNAAKEEENRLDEGKATVNGLTGERTLYNIAGVTDPTE